MRYFSLLSIIFILAFLSVGCSGGSQGANPVVPPPSENNSGPGDTQSKPQEIPRIAEIPDPLDSPLVETETKEDLSHVWYAGIMEYNPETKTISTYLDRETSWNFDITGFLLKGGCVGGCIRYKIISFVGNVVEVDVTIENPTPLQGYDVRLIFTVLAGKSIKNPDGYTDLYDPPSGSPINPFIAFATDSYFRDFPPGPGGKDTQKVFINWPPGSGWLINYIVTASYPENTKEPFVIDSFEQLGDLTYEGGNANLSVRVDDYQWDITEVRADLRIFNNQIPYLVSNPEQPDHFEVNLTNSNHAFPGAYPTLFMAKSPNAQNASMYNIFDVIVTGPPQHPPVCDFYIEPDHIWVGETTWLYPGNGISDPDDDNIVLYEFDYYYNDGVFNMMASNTTGDPIESPTAPYLGPDPVTITMALRITDDGVPPMSSICTDTLVIYGNQAPVCDLKVDPIQIPSGGTVQLSPGTNCDDPDGSIILYEYDKDYDGVTFNVDYSNINGAPVTAGPYDNPGPNPKTFTIGMRVTDNGNPQLNAICTKQITVVVNQAPVCDLKVDPLEIPTGGTVQLSPGPNCKDPDGSIVLYEYDKDYDNVTFNVDYSNTDGSPVTAGPYSNPGPNPKTFTIGMRVTDNGNPQLKSTCTKQITVVANQTPNCELILSSYEINSGASVDCWPGPGTFDPDGSIVLYEYDFDYNGSVFDVNASNTDGSPVATGPIDNTSGSPITRVIAMRVTDNGTPSAKKICTKNLIVNPIMVANNPWRDPAVRVTPSTLDWASIERNRMENNLCVYGNNVYVIYHGSISDEEGFYIQRSNNGGVTFNAPQDFNYSVNCTNCVDIDFIAADILANGSVGVVTFGYMDNCAQNYRAYVRFTVCTPNGSGGVNFGTPIELSRAVQGYFSTQAGDGCQSIDIAAHPTDPNICFVDLIDLDNVGGVDGPDDLSLWKISNITTTPTATLEFTVVPPLSGSPPGSGQDKAHIDAVCDYNGNLHVAWCCRDLGTLYYSMVYGNTAYPFEFTDYIRVNLFGETYPEGAHVAIDNNNNAYISYAASGIPGEIAPQEIGMLIGVGYPPTFPNPPIILNHDRTGNQVYPDIEFDQTTNDLWVAYTTFANGPGQITFELYDAEDGWTQFQPNYWINKDDNTNQHDDENVHLYFVSSTGTAYAVWMETSGPNSPHLYFNRTK